MAIFMEWYFDICMSYFLYMFTDQDPNRFNIKKMFKIEKTNYIAIFFNWPGSRSDFLITPGSKTRHYYGRYNMYR